MQAQRQRTELKKTRKGFVVVGIVVIVILLYGLFIVQAFSSWQERGLFGDAFGALNALASSLALIGVVYAFYLQQRQLEEMQRATRLQQQPVFLLDAAKFKIDPPTVFHGSADEPPCSALSRYHCEMSLNNVSEIPAVNAVLSARLACDGDGIKEDIFSVGSHCAMIGPHVKDAQSIMLVPNEPYTALFKVLRNRDAFSLPRVFVTLVYRNLLGACFRMRQAYHVVPSEGIEATLKLWHATISSFSTQHQEDLKKLAAGKADNDLFDRLKRELAQTLGQQDPLPLDLVPIPGAFDVQAVDDETYFEHTKSVGLPRLTFADTECPITQTRTEAKLDG